ncbi:fatty acid desaturase [Terrabacter sp. Root85]|uniref:fatty acid desaturase family protein n=1 Tax=unclassified Terrabacter TaxID=2630222 RepID=UPI0006F2BBA9|nr:MULTISPECIES: acyl-CoA desaturase [unclassified Terrabacter]KRC92222.1 fatty acid desaturase [Terrabacter sp. Root85]KRF48909.1 fatty acid desaturase [Terrabacter sp. Soil811]
MTATTNRPTTTPLEAAATGVAEGTAPTTRNRKPVLAASGGPAKRPSAAAHLSDADVEQLGKELDALRDRVIATRGAADAAYIRRVIRVQRTLEVAGRATLLFSKKRTAFVAGTAMLSVAKILENMEIGHNVLHGQWDWMRDPDIHSTTWEWDFVTPAAAWKHTHNDLHHTWTNVLGKDKDVGYSILRMDEDQPWHPGNLGNPLYNMILAPFFEWGIAIYDLELEAVKDGEKSKDDLKKDLKAMGRKVVRQFTKDYAATPLAAVPFGSGKQALIGTFTANAIRNVWAHSVIFCGHFPDGVDTFTEEEIEGETRGDWYIRQMLGSANISGSKLMHLMTGNLSHQIEHHCFPDLPSNRYHEVAVEVREICERYGLPYTTGPLPKQVYQAWAKVFRLALPNRPRPLPKNAARAVNAPVPPRRPALPMVARVG